MYKQVTVLKKQHAPFNTVSKFSVTPAKLQCSEKANELKILTTAVSHTLRTQSIKQIPI